MRYINFLIHLEVRKRNLECNLVLYIRDEGFFGCCANIFCGGSAEF